MRIIILDTETTDLNEPRLVQLGYKDLATGNIVNELFKPPVPIAWGAMATHHFTNEMVAEKPVFIGSEEYNKLNTLLQDNAVLVAHNAPFDILTLKNEGVVVPTWIDTCRVAQHTVPSEQHKLQYLRYFLNLPLMEATAHDALGDVLVLEALFAHLQKVVMEKYSLQGDDEVLHKMIELSQTPLLIKTIGFGKYKGMTFEELYNLDRAYLQWLHNSETQKAMGEQNENMVYTLKYYLDGGK